MLWLDFETRSHCDLKKHGVYNYATHPSTEVLCMSYAWGDDPVRTWRPPAPFPDDVRYYTGRIAAHNAAFERLIFQHVLKVEFAPEQFYCTATQARANCAPGSLEDVGRFLGASMRKDHKGAALVRKFCVPPFSNEDPSELIRYCEQDVRAMRAVSQAMRPLSDDELRDYHINERVNDKGVAVDVRLAVAAQGYASEELISIQREVQKITGIGTLRSPRMREWIIERLTPEQAALAVKDDKPSVDKAVRANLLACSDLDETVREVIQSLDDVSASSVAKFERMANLASPDGRVRGAFVFAGGSATGRASSYGLQVHNFTRKTMKAPDDVRHAIVRGHQLVPAFGTRVSDVLRGMLRPAITGDLTVADWSSIEARVTPWASGRGDAKLDVFRSGRDPYKVNAAATFGVEYDDVTDEQRQIGKVQELACGFAGGVGAFAAMGRIYGITLEEPEAQRMVDGWRRANGWAVPYWQALENAYRTALNSIEQTVAVGRIIYKYDGTHLWYMLPSGRVLCYPFARFEENGDITYAKASWKPAADAKQWPRARLWRGLACENITQAIAADILRHALRQLDDVVLHVHDEIVIDGDGSRLAEVMATSPPWASDLPLKAEVKTMTRYQK
jgi:DNA polymerase